MTLKPGQMLSHYRLLEVIGEGGMGIVYRALDVGLDRQVAVKILPPDLTADPMRRQRFLREARAAAAVTHPNIITVHEVDEAGGITFIVMELAEGKSLRALIGGHPLPIPDALRFARQIAEGLAWAHRARIVHRDLKPENIIIGSGRHAKILDFGIAKLLDDGDEPRPSGVGEAPTQLTVEGKVLGTADYMSPEQARGEAADLRSDIFSFGATLYEMVTGRAPFRGESWAETLSAILKDDPVPASRLNPAVPPGLARVLERCLQKDPERRYQASEELLLDIERIRPARTRLAFLRGKRIVAATLAAVVLVLAGVTAAVLLRPTKITPGPGGRLSVAVLPFENLAAPGEMDWLRTGLVENLSTDLAQSKLVRVLTRERVGRILRDLGYDESDALEREALAGVAEYGGVQAVFSGSFVSAGEDLRVNLRAIDPKTGEVIGSAVVPGTASEVLAMIDTLTVRAKEILRISSDAIAADVDTAIADARTASVEAASLFQRGVELLHAGRNLEAIEPLEQATRIDPDFALAHARLSETYRNVGYGERAREASERAVSSVLKVAARISLADRAFVRAIHADASGNRQEAIEAYTEMLEADPYDATAAYDLGLAYEKSGQWSEAERYYERTLKLDEKFALALISLGRIRVSDGRPRESLSAFEEALEIYVRMGSKEGEGYAHQALCEANISLRQWDEAMDRCDRSRSIKEAIGDKRGIAASLSSTAYILQVKGRLDDALDTARRSLKIQREIGDAYGTAASLSSVVSILHDRGELHEAVASCDEAIEILRGVGERASEAELHIMRGTLCRELGDFTAAAEGLDAAEALLVELGIDSGAAQLTSDRGLLALERGELSAAQNLLRDALGRWERLENSEGISETEYRLAKLAVHRARYGTALRLARKALSDYEAAEDRLNSARCRAVIGRCLLRMGDLEAAARVLDRGLELAGPLGNPILVTELETARAEVHLGQGALEASSHAADLVCERAGAGEVPRLEYACKLVRARIALAEGEAGTAASLASEAASRAGELGFGHDALEGRLIEAEARAAQDDAAVATSAVSLVEEAREAGAYALILRAVPLAAASLLPETRSARLPHLGGLLRETLEAIRADLPADRLPVFLEHGLDSRGCRRLADDLREIGQAAQADRLAALLRP